MNENTNISTNEENGVATEAANEEAKTYTQEIERVNKHLTFVR